MPAQIFSILLSPYSSEKISGLEYIKIGHCLSWTYDFNVL